MWHTHILANIGAYNEDCRRIIGHVLHHDDSLTDRSEGSNLDVAFKATKKLWRKSYGSDYVVEGGMFRGDPPIAYFAQNFFDGDIAHSLVHPLSGPYLCLVGKVGASSTIPKEDEDIPTVNASAVAPSAPPLSSLETPPAASIKTTTVKNRPDGSTLTTTSKTNADGQKPISTYANWMKEGMASFNQRLEIAYQNAKAQQATTTEEPALPHSAASSFGTTTTTVTTTPANMSNSLVVVAGSPVSGWLNASGTATDGSSAFIAAQPRSTTRGVNANPRRIGYVFGTGALGVGYYHMETKDASELMHKRLLVAQEKKRSEVAILACCQACCFCFASFFEEKKKKSEDVNDMVAVAKARSEAQIPLGAVGMSANNPMYKDFYGNDGRWQYPQYYAEAAACGGGRQTSGGIYAGCGACVASCGAGACGGGGGKIICVLNTR
jgi:hypothetical protein